MSQWTSRRVVAFAHQGGSFEGPSSTLAAIDHALEVGATAIELDVHATKDRRLVVCHDATVDRTTNHEGEIAQLSYAQLSEMDNAYRWIDGDVVTPGRAPEEYLLRGRAPSDRRYGVATLEEVATAFPGVLLNLDLKRTSPEVEPYEALLFDELKRLELTDSVIVASFHDEAIQRFRSLAPDVATSAATNETAVFYFSLLEGTPVIPPVAAFQVPATFGDVDVVTEAFVAAAHAADVAVHVWTINDVDEMTRLLERGVDGLISDRPTPLAALLRQRDCAWDGKLG
ncbi:MAG TPA: glycerophosphodiester phosphodiesterase [Acidimicrobiales bacterium]|jgi:glycerophosphoryl diester phosphodiesterase|nr:glycerophosphodiester phosphodiesterase [Acidimicrobiales bacterium]